MERPVGSEGSANHWKEWAHSELAAFGPFPQAHVAPRIPPGLLTDVLRTEVSLRDDERVLVVIDCGSGGFDDCCVLTTRRVCWAAVEHPEDPSEGKPDAARSTPDWGSVPGGPRDRSAEGDSRYVTVLVASAADGEGSGRSGAGVGPPGGQGRWYRWVDYVALPEEIGAEGTWAGTHRLDLGCGRTLALRGADPRLMAVLARCLQTLGAAARAGGLVGPNRERAGSTPAALVAHAAPADAPPAAARGRIPLGDLIEFQRALDQATRRVIMTPVLVLTCVAVFAAMAASGVPVFWPTATQLIAWGANEGRRVILREESWRLLTMAFVHGGLIHLVMNVWSLWVIGPLVERIYGPLAFLVVYLAAGVGGAIASAAVTLRVSVGASGAICGVLGALLAFLTAHRRSIPASVIRQFRTSILGIVAFMAVLGALVPNIDQAAHLGGLGTGFVAGLLLSRPWPVVPSRWIAIRRLVMTAAIAAALAGTAVATVRWSERIVPPSRRFADLIEQLAPAVEEFESISRSVPTAEALPQIHSDPMGRGIFLQRLRQLSARGTGNLARLRRASTTDPELRTMCDALIGAQASQRDRLDALLRFLETGDPRNLTAADGEAAARAAFGQAVQEFERLRRGYLAKHNLIAGPSSSTR
jgi:rhomboid protease GluP